MTNNLTNNSFTQEKLDKECAIATINSEIDTIIKLREMLDSSLTQALDAMQQAKGKIILSGMGKSGHVGKKIAASLASTGTPSFFVHPAEACHGDLGMITQDDVIIAISNSGAASELMGIINYCNRLNITIIAITKNPQSPLGKAANIVLKIPNNGEACPLGLAPTSSTTSTLVLGDILTTCLIKRKSFTKNDFNERHPGGKLGTILMKVSDIMHTGSSMPLLDEHANMHQVILEITEKRLGCVGFINKDGVLTGMLTDGDLRRCLTPEILNQKSIQLMSKNPKTIEKDIFASAALEIMNKNKITNIFVVENNIPIGVIHIHDILNKEVL